jgi:hypothetical protein
MGISIAICETDSDASLCKVSKTTFVKVYLGNVQGYEQYAEADLVISAEAAKKAMGADFEAFAKRNRLDPASDVFYVEKLKNEADRAKLAPEATKNYTGWVFVDKAPSEKAREIISKSSPDDRLTGWDMLSFEDMGETCKKCGLSWDSGRGCIGDFGPEKSLLIPVASKYGLGIIANVVESAKAKKVFSHDDANELLREVKVLREKLPGEEKGKLLMSRYSGVLDRLENTANIALKYRTKFYFI